MDISPPSFSSILSFRLKGVRALTSLALLFILLVTGGCLGPDEPEGSYLSFLQHRELRILRQVTMTVDGLPTDGADADLTLSLVAEDPTTGERLTILVPAASLEGSHPMSVFGNLKDRGGKLVPISNACKSGGNEMRSSGTLSIEVHDAEARTLDGSFIANVCRVDDAEQTWTLADGKFRGLTYGNGNREP